MTSNCRQFRNVYESHSWTGHFPLIFHDTPSPNKCFVLKQFKLHMF